ncbi:DUF2989 domain-containing protein [Gallaecimonas xiamenensis]|uniref:Lipoprotein n=1 Tax=Gallaecimonas xiamenensis 3-C-1 TaxID=745411 RepID=K2JRB2_9GAMM|nr:DUF2989 domain-containing protein [Gallaecimonas xiamenensis]EKE77923.1 hypothetical protein B3C1_00645 [Gallaecimonas xiamenensis 3-C-1]
MKKLFCLLPLVLAGCGGDPSLSNICSDNPQLCSDLNSDGWCRRERSELIRQRYIVDQGKGTDFQYQQYLLLKDTETYSECIRIASGVIHKNQKDRQSDRGTAYINSLVALKALQAQIKNADELHLLYYRYTRFGDNRALQAFLAKEGTGAFNTLELKSMLAGHYAKTNKAKTVQLLLEGLALPREDDKVDPEIYQTLATLSQQLRHYQEAYLWSKVAADKGVNIDTGALEMLLGRDQSLLDDLQDKAKAIEKAIEKNQFKTAMAILDNR